MARYNTLDDGSSLIETDDGRQVRTALDPQTLEQNFGATLDPELQLTKRANDITQRVDDVRAKYDPDYAASREEQRKKASEAQGRLELDDKANQLKQQIDEQRAQDLSGATAQNDAANPWAASVQGVGKPGAEPPRTATDAGGAYTAPANPNMTPAKPAPVRLVPDTSGAQGAPSMGSYAASQSQQSPVNGDLMALAKMAASQAVTRTGATKGGWVPTSRSVARDNVPPTEFVDKIDEAEMGVEDVAKSNAEMAAKRYNETVVSPQLDQLERNTAALEAAYQRRQKYDAELAQKKKLAEDAEKAAAEMKMPNVRDDYFDNNGGTLGRFLAGIVAGAGQWGAMVTGGNNAALGIINDAIKDHGQMLRDRHDQAKENAKDKRNAYGQLLAQYGDPESAQEALMLKGETIADRMIKVQMGRHMNAQENAQLDQWLAQRKVDRAARWADIAGKAAGRTLESESYARPTGGGTSVNLKAIELAGKLAKDAQGQVNPEAWRQDAEAISRAVRLDPEDAKRLGTPVLFGTDKEEKAKAQLAIQASSKANTAIARMREIYATPNWEANPDLVADLEANGGVIQALIANPLGLRQQTKEELEKISGPLVGLQGTQWGKLDSQALKSLGVADRLFRQEKTEWMRTLLRDPYRPNFAEGDVETKPVRGKK